VNRVEMARAEDGTTPGPGQWALWGEEAVILCCPTCSQTSVLDHEVTDEGLVNASVVHKCGWHVYVKLLGWRVP